MKKILLFIILILLSAFVTKVFAQTANLTFPIPELGNCTSLADCKAYCDDPTHTTACIAYAKEKGFYQPTSLDTNAAATLADAKATLGCDSVDSCRAVCQKSENAAVCSAFAQKHNLRGGQQTTSNTTLAKAEAAFGCNSLTSCQAFCDQDSNKATCANFAKTNGINGGNETMGPGGCTSSSTCKTYCSDPNNFQTCKDFVDEHAGSSSAKPPFTGPGGCTSEESCQSFCSKNPTICHLNPSGQPAPMSATGAAHMDDRGIPMQSIEKFGTPSSETSNQKYCSERGCLYNGTGCVCPQQMPTAPPNHPIPQQGFPTLKPSMPPTGGEQPSFPNGSVKPSVEGVSTHIDFFQWLINQLLHV